MTTPFGPTRPVGLRLDHVGGTWWRLDAEHPDDWTWAGFPEPRHRFDPPSGRFRVRYAANRAVAAARERFAGKVITAADAGILLVALAVDTPALHLTRQANLDALGLDDRISTGRLDSPTYELADAVHDWWQGRPPALVYRTRTMPAARSLAFTEHNRVRPFEARPLRDATRLLAALVARHGFVVPSRWLG